MIVAWGKSALIREAIWNFCWVGQRSQEVWGILAKQGKSDHDARGMLACNAGFPMTGWISSVGGF